jgi:hypothetical protein
MKNDSTRARCADCYFRQAALCALRLDEACPTFRPYASGALATTQQPVRLPPRPLADVVRAPLNVAAA